MKVKLPSQGWRDSKAEERQKFLAGKITAKECFMESLFPDEFIDRTDTALKLFVANISNCSPHQDDYPKVRNAIKSLVLDLNKINDDFDGSVIETGEREEICDFIDDVIVAHGIDIDAYAEYLDCGRYELADEWRDW